MINSDLKEYTRITLKLLGGLGLVFAIGAGLILGFAGLSYAVQWIWGLTPFGIAGFILGLLVIAGTFYFSGRLFPERDISLSWSFMNQLELLEVLGYLYGICLLIVSFMWFVLPNPVVGAFPSMKDSIGFYIVAPMFIYGIGICFQGAIKGFRVFLFAGLFWGACAFFGLYFVNYHIWAITQRIPNDFFIFGKALFGLILFLQILYIFFFHLFPAVNEYHLAKMTEERKVANTKEK